MERNSTSLEGIKKMIADGIVTQDVAEKYFPELKESEDERTQLTEFLKDMIDKGASDRYGRKDFERWKFWLEKQGEQNPYSGVSFEYNGHTWGMCARDNGVEILVDGEIKERVYLFDRPQGKSALETLKEEKADNQNCANPVVKIEPKFKVGDWVVDKEGNISKIMRVDNGFNHIIYACRFIEQKSVFWSSYSENDIRLWDITEDAKDGDVLASNRSIFIFSQEYIAGKPEAHCGIMNGFFIVKPKGCWTNEKIYPANKEQRYFLFTKIREAGYEWDAEKKKLEKIEQKSTDKTESTVNNYITPNKQFFQWIYDRLINVHNENPNVDYMLSLKERIENMQKTAWSVEDEDTLDNIIDDYDDADEHNLVDDTGKVMWLKSLKERFACEANCTTTKEWKPSKKQIMELRWVLIHMPNNSHKEEISGLVEQLKKLINK